MNGADRLEAINVDVAFPCPFCGLAAGASANPPTVIHALPHCAKFAELEAADFLRAARLAAERAPSSSFGPGGAYRGLVS